MSIDELSRRLDMDGWCIVDCVMPRDEVGTVRDNVLATLESSKDGVPEGR